MAAFSTLEERLAKTLECAVCLDTFDDPRMLRCQHSYCKKCLEKIVVRVGNVLKVTCPECREEIKLSPRTGVAGIHSNLLINNLLQLSGKQSNVRPSCDKHYDELVELYCERCDKPICQACLVIDHRDHPYSFIKDVFPDKKREMVKLMNEAKSKMSALRAEVLALEGEGNKLRKNDEAVSREIDTFIDATIEKHTAIMERERQRLKQEVHAKTAQQLCKLQGQKESLVESLSSMEFVSNSVDSTKKIEFLRSKKEIESKLAGLKSFAQEFHPCEKVLYKLDKKPFEEGKMQGVANIDTQTEYCLSMTGGEPGVIYTGRVWQWCEFTLTVNSDVATHHRNALNDFRVTVLAPNEEIPFCRCVEDKGNGSCGFGFRPAKSGDHKIFIHNEKLFGGEAHCSPLTWKVLPPFCLRSWIFWLGHCISFVFRDYKYLRDCLYEDGQHSWRIRMVGQREPQDLRQRGPQDHSVPVFIQIGVVNPFKDLGWYWQNSQHISPGSGVPSSVKSLHRGDVLVCFLDMRKKQLVMYNERTKESDIWRDIKGPVTPYLSPDAFLYDVYFSVGE